MKILSAVKIECPNVVRITEGPYCRGYFYRKYSFTRILLGPNKVFLVERCL